MQANRLGIYCMGPKGLSSVKAVAGSLYKKDLAFVVIAKDDSVANDFVEDIQQFCKDAKINVYWRTSSNIPSVDLVIAVGWRWLIETAENQSVVVIHDSLLPSYRGFAPVVAALENGDTELGATAIFANRDYDRGDVIAQRMFHVDYPIKISTVIDLMTNTYSELILEALDRIGDPNFKAIPQDSSLATYSLWRDEEDYQINWQWDSARILRFINATGHPYRGAKTKVNGVQLRVLEAELVEDVQIMNRVPGKVIFVSEQGATVVCGEGLIRLTKVVDETSGSDFKLPAFRIRFS